MNNSIHKAIAALELYNPWTLLVKLHELYIINPVRFYQPVNSLGLGFEVTQDNQDVPATPVPDPCVAGNKPRTIWYLIHCFYPFSQGGTERFVYNMARQAQQVGHQVLVVTYNALDKRRHFSHRVGNILYHEYRVDGLDVIEYRHRRAPRGIVHDILTEDPDVDEFVRFLFKRERPDIVHAAYLQKVTSFLSACHRLGVPYGITFTSFFCMCHFDILIDKKGVICGGCQGGARCRQICACLEIPDAAARQRRMKELLLKAVFLTCPSQFVQRTVVREFSGVRLQVINHGISREFGPHSSGTQPPRVRVTDFAYFGNVTPIKGVHILIEAFRDMPRDYTLNIYGSGPESYLRHLRQLIQGNKNIRLHGKVPYDQMRQAYEANQAVVVPSIWPETYNFVIHEALLMGKLVIASRIGAMPELIRDGINGLLFVPGDSQDLQRCLRQAIALDFRLPSPDSFRINTIEGEFACYHRIYESVLEEAVQP